jgi:hypothetical protein
MALGMKVEQLVNRSLTRSKQFVERSGSAETLS